MEPVHAAARCCILSEAVARESAWRTLSNLQGPGLAVAGPVTTYLPTRDPGLAWGCLSRMKKMLQDALGSGERNVGSAAGTRAAGLPTVLSAPGSGSAT